MRSAQHPALRARVLTLNNTLNEAPSKGCKEKGLKYLCQKTQCDETLERAATNYSDGKAIGFERISE